MIGQVAPPEPVLSLSKDVEHAHHTQLPTDKAGGMGQVLHRCCRGTKEQIIDLLLIAPCYSSQLARKGDRNQKVGDGKK